MIVRGCRIRFTRHRAFVINVGSAESLGMIAVAASSREYLLLDVYQRRVIQNYDRPQPPGR
jgi:hypothetical protein